MYSDRIMYALLDGMPEDLHIDWETGRRMWETSGMYSPYWTKKQRLPWVLFSIYRDYYQRKYRVSFDPFDYTSAVIRRIS